ncbi:OmpA family protein [Desulfococcaceae bacterium HSG8]|nr:OmpA family protein [Desulfococcaceae bacterium HSG8]
MKNIFFVFIVVAIALSSGMTGCATKTYVNKQVELLAVRDRELNDNIQTVQTEVEKGMGKVWKEIGTTQEDIIALKDTVEEQKEKINELNTSEEAVERAEEAGKLGKGKLLYEVTMSDESVFFAYKKRELSDEAELALNVFANILVAENKDVFIEIQGHTDDIGSEDYNLELGQSRAETVKRYLHTEHEIPLHRMSVFSYGESEPVVPNNSEINRSKNRRVVLLVME